MKVVYVLVNTSLGMNAGKASAQVAHAVSGLFSKNSDLEEFKIWNLLNPRAIIVLDGKSEEDMRRLSEYLENTNVKTFTYIDEGTSFRPTAMAVSPLDKEDSNVVAIFRQYKLFENKDTLLEERVAHLEELNENRYNMIVRYHGLIEGISDRIQNSKIRSKGHYLSSKKRLLRDIKKTLEGDYNETN